MGGEGYITTYYTTIADLHSRAYPVRDQMYAGSTVYFTMTELLQMG